MGDFRRENMLQLTAGGGYKLHKVGECCMGIFGRACTAAVAAHLYSLFTLTKPVQRGFLRVNKLYMLLYTNHILFITRHQ